MTSPVALAILFASFARSSVIVPFTAEEVHASCVSEFGEFYRFVPSAVGFQLIGLSGGVGAVIARNELGASSL